MDSDFWNTEFRQDPDYVDVADQILGPEVRGLTLGTALDLGCGSGKNALILAELGWTVIGVDWAEEAIRLARQATRGRDLEATFIVADTTKWTPGTQFNLVVSTYTLPGGENSRHVLQTAANAVAPVGTLIIAEWDRSMAEVWPFAAEDLTTPDEIAGVLRGLAVERAEVRRIDVFAKDDPRASSGTAANVAFVRARRRAQRPGEPTSGP